MGKRTKQRVTVAGQNDRASVFWQRTSGEMSNRVPQGALVNSLLNHC
jgi:hypothetical protein